MLFYTSVIEKMSLDMDIAKENIRYDKLLQDTRYIKISRKYSNSNKEKICYINMTNITPVDPQTLEDY